MAFGWPGGAAGGWVGEERSGMGRRRRRKQERREAREREALAAASVEREKPTLEELEREAGEQTALMREALARDVAATQKAAARAQAQLEREARLREVDDQYRQKMERIWRRRSEGREQPTPAGERAVRPRGRPARRARVPGARTVRVEVRVRETPAEPAGPPAGQEVPPVEGRPVVEVRDDPGWGVLLDGQVRVVVCGEGTPFGPARDFQMSVSPAAGSRGLVASARRDGDRVRVEARSGPRLGERPAQPARYRWDEWLDGEPLTIRLGPDSEFPGVRAQQLVDAALRAGKTRGLKVATRVSDGGLTVMLQASPPKPVVRVGKYPWAEWFNGAEHHVDLTDPQWGNPRPDSFRISVARAAKRHGVEAHLIPVVDQTVLDSNLSPAAWNAAVRQSTQWVVHAAPRSR
jgi:hypothetical protein